ncbi:MAG: hypothetical protein HYW45_01825 [Candidatus Daviesbacteria bacterium]|nr:MAG: hypothetical protein HYW45_01825 [Candidatus Daviesbacteria bacterium]
MEYNIKEGNRPTVYDLGVGKDGKNLTITIHSQALENLQDLLANPTIPVVEFLQHDLSLPAFMRPSSEWPWWGFGPVLGSLPPQREEYSMLECPLPVVKKNADDLNEEPNWQPAFATSATLNVLFTLLALDCVEIPDNKYYQLAHVNLFTKKGMHGGSLSVILAKSLMPWLSDQPDESDNKDIEIVMKSTHEHMFGYSDIFSPRDFRVWFRQPKWVNLSVPGDACGLDPSDYHDQPGKGYNLSPHNVDNPVQQLTLLMGIAAICEEARKAGF